ncbi:MAG TPA: hypothetical protein VK604_01045 [Bryobacteraceae bacterium]|nr:hypothetical protein [Bryobacteraceae bacterium]
MAGSKYSTIAQTDDGANANYNGVVLSLQHRFTNIFTVLSNYTYSRCLSSTNFAGDLTGPTYQNPANRNAYYGSCSFDLRQNFVLSVVAKMPKLPSARANRLFGGWQLAPILSIHSGTPFSPLTGTDNSRTGVNLDRPNVLNNPYVENLDTRQWIASTAFTSNAIGTFGNAGSYSLIGPGYFDIDFSLSRIFTVGEIHHVEVRSEFFNVTNHANFTNPSGTLRSQSFGQLLAASDPRIIQFALKYSF